MTTSLSIIRSNKRLSKSNRHMIKKFFHLSTLIPLIILFFSGELIFLHYSIFTNTHHQGNDPLWKNHAPSINYTFWNIINTNIAKSSIKNSHTHTTTETQLFSNENFLLYYSHDGFTNQIMGLDVAFKLSKLTRRTLVLPPVLLHYPERPHEYDFGYMTVAEPNKTEAVKQIAIQVGRSLRSRNGGNLKFPSFSEIMDWEKTLPITYRYMDFPEFMKSFVEYHSTVSIESNSDWIENLVHEKFYIANSTILDAMQNKDTPTPEQFYNLVHDNFGQDQIVVIGSAFTRRRIDPTDHTHPLWDFKPSTKFQIVLSRILHTLGTEFVGVHIRVSDFLMVKAANSKNECQSPSLVQHYQTLFDQLESQKQKGILSSSDTIYLGYTHPVVKKCFHTLFPKTSTSYNNVVTIMDILSQDPIAKQLWKEIHLEENTALLVLDQLLLGLGKVLVMECMNWESTFQMMLQRRHEKRDEILSTLLDS